jgi:hypothetical protein
VRVQSLIDPLHQTTVISRNTPYKIICTPLFASIEFGQGEDSILVPIYGLMTPQEEQAPQLGVDKESIAAAHLSEMLCGWISASMQNIMLADPQTRPR